MRLHPLVLHGYGLVEAPFERVVDAFASATIRNRSSLSLEGVVEEPERSLDYLVVRTHPATRLVLVDLEGWTAALTNGRNGSDFNDHQRWVADAVGARTIRVVDSDARRWQRDGERERLAYEARIVEVLDGQGRVVRSITCMDDGGRWTFEASGTPFPIESTFDYDARRARDRFTRENLRALLGEIGPGALTEGVFVGAPRFALVAERLNDDAWRARVEADACTLEEADDPALGYYRRGMSYVPHMDTHASSVAADLGRAVRLNPALEPRVRRYLDEAARVLGEASR